MTDPTTSVIDPQPAPVTNDQPALWPLVIADMQARDDFGRAKYGTPLQAFNGRDPLVDAYQEALDKTVYLRGAIIEREWMVGEIARLREENARVSAERDDLVSLLSGDGGLARMTGMRSEVERLKTRNAELLAEQFNMGQRIMDILDSHERERAAARDTSTEAG